jgi:hypothetical protein
MLTLIGTIGKIAGERVEELGSGWAGEAGVSEMMRGG